MESDWKKFRAMIPVWRERYLAAQNARLVGRLVDPALNHTERFWSAFETTQNEARTLRECLDGHSRSSMERFLLTMRGAGMITEPDLTDFSPELRRRVFSDSTDAAP